MIVRLLSALAALAGGALSSQLPEFAQQYLQRLGGQLDQLRRQTEALRSDAAAEGLTLRGYVDLFVGSDVSAHQRAGRRMLELVQDYESVQSAHDALIATTPLLRPAALFQHLDPLLAQATFNAYSPALPLTASGAIYALAGGAVLWLCVLGGSGLVKRRRTTSLPESTS